MSGTRLHFCLFVVCSLINNSCGYQAEIKVKTPEFANSESRHQAPVTSSPNTTVPETAPETIVSETASSDASVLDNRTEYSLLKRLRDTEKPFFGNQRAYQAYQDNLNSIHKLTGKNASVAGFPLADILRNEGGFEDGVARAISIAKLGAIMEMDWHVAHPNTGSYKTVKDKQKKPLGTDSITSVLPGGASHKPIQQKLEKIGDFFLRLKQENIEVLFRPWHEMNGKWFWWGEQNPPEDFIALYNWTVSYLDGRGCTNVYYVFAPNYRGSSTKTHYESLYPGDRVSVIGLDYYGPDFSKITEDTLFLNDFAASRGKILALTEFGPSINGFTALDSQYHSTFYSSVANYMSHFNFKYIRTWTASFLPDTATSVADFNSNFVPMLRLLP